MSTETEEEVTEHNAGDLKPGTKVRVYHGSMEYIVLSAEDATTSYKGGPIKDDMVYVKNLTSEVTYEVKQTYQFIVVEYPSKPEEPKELSLVDAPQGSIVVSTTGVDKPEYEVLTSDEAKSKWDSDKSAWSSGGYNPENIYLRKVGGKTIHLGAKSSLITIIRKANADVGTDVPEPKIPEMVNTRPEPSGAKLDYDYPETQYKPVVSYSDYFTN